jgi:hypothetical protein
MDGRTGKYLKYAIGEIFLVVIGILIALGINNWNHKNNEIKREVISLNNLISDLEEQYDVLSTYIEVEEEFHESGIYVLEHYAENKAFVISDTLLSKLNILMFRNTFSPIKTTYEELVSTGDIGQIRDKSLKRKIMQCYSNLERDALVTSSNNTNLIDGLFNPVLFEQTLLILKSNFKAAHVKQLFDDFQLKQNKIFDPETLNGLYKTSGQILGTPEKELKLFNVLQLRVLLARSQLIRYERLQKDVMGLRDRIEQELKK